MTGKELLIEATSSVETAPTDSSPDLTVDDIFNGGNDDDFFSDGNGDASGNGGNSDAIYRHYLYYEIYGSDDYDIFD